jgi:hypothetical protein
VEILMRYWCSDGAHLCNVCQLNSDQGIRHVGSHVALWLRRAAALGAIRDCQQPALLRVRLSLHRKRSKVLYSTDANSRSGGCCSSCGGSSSSSNSAAV